MRTALLPLAIAAATVIGTFQSTVDADDDLRPGKVPAPKGGEWELDLLAGDHPGGGFPRTVARLAPYLDPAIYRALDPRQRLLLMRYARHRFESPDPVARCWAPDTPLEVLMAYHAVEEAARAEDPPPPAEGDDPGADPSPAPRKAMQFFRRWSTTATNGGGEGVQGRPVTLTWSIVPDGTPIPSDPGIGDSNDPSNLRARLAQIYGGDTGPPENQPWFGVFQSMFENISANTGLVYVYEPDDDGQELGGTYNGRLGTRGDVRLGGHDIDGDGSTLAYNFFPNTGDMVIDTNDNWFTNTTNNSIRLRNTLEHEHGHGIGMEHVCPIDNTKLMEPFINRTFRGIQFDEIYTLQRWYGDFYEHHNSARNNDTFDNAAPLPVNPGTPFGVEWLSIDDNGDVDYFALLIPLESEITVRVTPSTLSYLEGEQLASGTCSSGAPFDPGANHDLTVELIGPNRNDILATANAAPAGQLEEIVAFTTPAQGTHYLRIGGGDANLAQLYRLDIEVTSPAISLALDSQSITAESFSLPNGRIEPGETVALELALTNGGSLDATAVQATLGGPAGFTGFDVAHDFGVIAPAQVVTRTFIFGLEGDCGDSFVLDLTMTADGGVQRVIPLEFPLGTVTTLLAQSFDSHGLNLPPGWNSGTNRNGSGWTVSDARFDSSPSSLYAEDVSSLGTSSLVSPPVTLGASGGTLRFRHYFDTEAGPTIGYDGGVLEVSSLGNPWQDIIAAGATFTEGGYVRTVSSAFQNPLTGRPAWAGDSGGWITTVVDLPPSLATQPIRFRWRLGHDSSVGSEAGFEGWYLDDITIVSSECAGTAAVVSLALDDDTTSEFAPLDLARLTFRTPLPRLTDLPIPLLNAGTATVGLDATGLDTIMIPAGQSEVQVAIQGINDTEVEGAETFVLSLDPAAGLVAEGIPSATITISDTPYGTWAATVLGLGTRNGPLEDRDSDGALNIEEYAWQTDGASPTSLPDLNPRRENGKVRIDAPLATLPADVLVSAESSPDLENWTPAGVQALADGFQVTAGNSEQFLRLVYQLLPAAP